VKLKKQVCFIVLPACEQETEKKAEQKQGMFVLRRREKCGVSNSDIWHAYDNEFRTS
jgi:hypothetical protein